VPRRYWRFPPARNAFVVKCATKASADLVASKEATFPPLLVVNSQSPYHSLADLIDAAHARPGVLTLGTIEVGSVTQLVFEMLKRTTKADTSPA
jgi:tripartite-type tricarboxylate transporter receptor subunit TctC